MERIADKQMLMELGTKVRLVGSKKKEKKICQSLNVCLVQIKSV